MSRLPLALSVPHAGLAAPSELAGLSMLSEDEIAADGDQGAAEIYFPLRTRVGIFETTETARAFVDLNRDVNDRRKDGVVKTHTCWDIAVYRQPLDENLVQQLLCRYYQPYHERLTAFASQLGVIVALDCHTMAEFGPPVGPDPGAERPLICLGNAHGQSCPDEWLASLKECLEQQFNEPVSINDPFSGGFITRSHGLEMPWVQLEMSRTARFTNDEKSRRLLAALNGWCRQLTAERRD